MVEISKPLSLAHVADYYKTEYVAVQNAYYTQKQTLAGEWHGTLAAQQGLTGQVSEEQYLRLAAAQDPHTGEQLTHANGTQRSGWDITFNASKTVSLTALVGGDDRVRQAHREAVLKTLDALEAYTQVRMGGNNLSETTGKWIVAVFEHDTARPVDGYPAPHLHTHAVLFNLSEDATGQTRALQTSELYKIQAMATAIYQAELGKRLRELGYQLEHKVNHAPDIKGYTAEYVRSESLRADQIESEMEKRGVTGREAKNIVSHSNREDKLNLGREELLKLHLDRAALHGNQPQKVYAEALARGPQVYKTNPELVRKSVSFAVNRNIEREAVIERFEIVRDALRRGHGRVLLPEVQAEVENRKETGALKPVHHVRSYAPGERYTTPEMVAMERGILEAVGRGRNAVTPVSSEQDRAAFRAQRPQLNDGQLWVEWNVLHSSDRFLYVNGGAGTGKTSALASLRNTLAANGYAVQGLAPTSGATKQLEERGISAITVQKHNAQPSHPDGKTFYFVDESSLAATKQVHTFLATLQPEDRVLFIGDLRQHQSVEAGRILGEMHQAGIQTFSLNTIVRQEPGKLRDTVALLSKGKTAEALSVLNQDGKIKTYEHRAERFQAIARTYAGFSGETLIVSPDNKSRKELNDAVRGVLKELGKLGEDVAKARTLVNRQDVTLEDRKAAIAYRTGDVVRFNSGSEKLGLGKLEYATVISADRQANTVTIQRYSGQLLTYDPAKHYGVNLYEPQYRQFAVGDRIQFSQKWKERGVSNREFGTIKELDAAGNIGVELASKRMVRWNLSQMSHVDHGYATTSHSAQGATVDNALVHIDTGDTRIRRLIDKAFSYVSLSRARTEAMIFTDNPDNLAKAMDRWQEKAKGLAPQEIAEYREQKTLDTSRKQVEQEHPEMNRSHAVGVAI